MKSDPRAPGVEKTGEIFQYRLEKSAPGGRENLSLDVVRLSGQQVLRYQ